MASHNIISRLSALLQGLLAVFVSNEERDHPEIVYQNSINSMIEKQQKARQATSAVIRRRNEIIEQKTSAEKELLKVNTQLEAALETNQDDIAVVLIERRDQLTERLVDLSSDLVSAEKDAETAKETILSLNNEIMKLKAEKDYQIARLKSAEAQIAIEDQLSGLSVDAEVQALTNVREHIGNKIAEAALNKELKETDVAERLKKLQNSSGRIVAESRLKELKAQRAAQAVKTL